MHISIASDDGAADVLTVEIAGDLTIRDLKAIIESDSGFALKAAEMNLIHDGKLLADETLTLGQCHLNDYDLITCQRRRPSAGFSSEATGATGLPTTLLRNIQGLFTELRSNPTMVEHLRRSDPQLAQAIERNNIDAFVQSMMARAVPRGAARQPALDLLDPRIQQRIEETINMENLQDNMEHAYEHAPEFFGHVAMLYINCKINGHPLKAFVDSGAQMTIMSKACAERCGILRLVDRRFAGVAKGVGTQEILGRIHLAQLEVEKQIFTTSLSVLADQEMDMLIGLDMLRRHRCVVDLQRNVLCIENVVETAFLPESELPEHARLSSSASSTERTDPTPPVRSPPEESPFPAKSIEQITKKGFSREQAIAELKLTNGDATKALVALMTKSLSKSQRKS